MTPAHWTLIVFSSEYACVGYWITSSLTLITGFKYYYLLQFNIIADWGIIEHWQAIIALAESKINYDVNRSLQRSKKVVSDSPGVSGLCDRAGEFCA